MKIHKTAGNMYKFMSLPLCISAGLSTSQCRSLYVTACRCENVNLYGAVACIFVCINDIMASNSSSVNRLACCSDVEMLKRSQNRLFQSPTVCKSPSSMALSVAL